jgi:hypothetical protein
MSGPPIDTMARTVWGEARGEGVAGMQAVASVILNRAAHPGWRGSDVASCCTHPYQFSCWLPGDPNRAKLLAVTADDPQFFQALAIATDALAGMLPDVTGGADSYYATGTPEPIWAVGLTPCAVIGRHQFYRTRAMTLAHRFNGHLTIEGAMIAAACAPLHAEIHRLRVALSAVRTAIVDAPGSVLTDTLWVSSIETAVDYIDAALSTGRSD